MRGNEEPFCRNSETTRVTIGQEELRTEMPFSGEIAFPQPSFLLTTTMHLPPSTRKVGREILVSPKISNKTGEHGERKTKASGWPGRISCEK